MKMQILKKKISLVRTKRAVVDGVTVTKKYILGIPVETRLKSDVEYKRKLFGVTVRTRSISKDYQSSSEPLVSNQQKQDSSSAIDYSDDFFLDKIKEVLSSLPESKGGRYYSSFDYKVGWITDDILYDVYKDTVKGVVISPDNWKQSLQGLDFLFFISCWNGLKNNEWSGIAVPKTPARKRCIEILQACHDLGIKTVFYTCEDPVSYDDYLSIAKECDFIFTSAIEMIPNYKRDCGHDCVYSLLYGVNPCFHNPVGMNFAVKTEDVFFAGSWYDKFPERCQDMATMIDGVVGAGRKLKIIDRCFSLNIPGFKFPSRYRRYLAPALKHDELQKVQKLYSWCLNFNSVKDSETMMANRTYEMSASGNVLLSNFSLGVTKLLPHIFTITDGREIPRILNSYSSEEIYERQVRGIRFAFSGNTSFERMHQILTTVGFNAKLPKRRVAVIALNDPRTILSYLEEQTFNDWELLSPEDFINRSSEFSMVTFMDSSRFYGEYYLEDMVNAFKYADVDFVTKDAYYNGKSLINGIEHDFLKCSPIKDRTVFWCDSYDIKKLLSSDKVDCGLGYSIDHFEFNETRPCPCYEDLNNQEYCLSVVIPVFNNGNQLYGKAFSSLRRSSMFKNIEIIIVDDGSSDKNTLATIKSLSRNYNNIKTYFYEKGGSGSPSRPRNRGIEMATSPYIAFLDPDDEANHDGFASMVRHAMTGNFDLVVGNREVYYRFNYVEDIYREVREKYGCDYIVGDKKDFLKRINFKAIGNHTMIMRLDLVRKNNLSYVIGGIGEDTLFAYQLICCADRILFTNESVNTYYLQPSGSLSSEVSNIDFFEKSLKTEKVLQEFLNKEGLLEDYVKLRLEPFFSGWYLKKCSDNSCMGGAKILSILTEICNLYYTGDKKCDEIVDCLKKQIMASLQTIPVNTVRQ